MSDDLRRAVQPIHRRDCDRDEEVAKLRARVAELKNAAATYMMHVNSVDACPSKDCAIEQQLRVALATNEDGWFVDVAPREQWRDIESGLPAAKPNPDGAFAGTREPVPSPCASHAIPGCTICADIVVERVPVGAPPAPCATCQVCGGEGIIDEDFGVVRCPACRKDGAT